jgi:2-polyprenyl-3-methyl-5-hydroxy-6-metoxy-1,4-benzoquinol methylase
MGPDEAEMTREVVNPGASVRILVALASYGTANDRYLKRIIQEYRSMSFDVDIVVISNAHKDPSFDCEELIGLPNRNPWSLPFSHKKLFADRLAKYDVFVYSEDDILLTERNLRAIFDLNAVLHHDEIAGFLRIEKDPHGNLNYPDFHGNFHWDPASVRSRGEYALAKFTNEHSACYVLTRAQLAAAISSGGFLVEPHEGKYDLLCTAATDPYTQCGFTKLIPVSHLEDFVVHHMSNKYFNVVGVSEAELHAQIDVLFEIAQRNRAPTQLFNTETRLPRSTHSKDYYEPVNEEVIDAIPYSARHVFSFGCGSGLTERRLAERGLRVVAVPLDPVIGSAAAANGVEIMHGDLRAVKEQLGDEKFDCVLCLNVLHLVREPAELLSWLRSLLSLNSALIIQTPNMMSAQAIKEKLRRPQARFSIDYDSTGAHFSSVRKMRKWCSRSGLRIERTTGRLHRHAERLNSLLPGFIQTLAREPLVQSTASSIVMSTRSRI